MCGRAHLFGHRLRVESRAHDGRDARDRAVPAIDRLAEGDANPRRTRPDFRLAELIPTARRLKEWQRMIDV